MPRQRLYQRIYQVKNLFKNVLTGRKVTDDFDWDLYTQHYKGELKHVEEKESAIIKPGDYRFVNNALTKVTSIKPLHLNHHLIYETVGQLKPQSVLEVGCGGGDQLYNLHVLFPDIALYGEDISENQLALLHNRHPGLHANIHQHNIISSHRSDWPPIDLVFTQAVVMHIKTDNNHRVALKNIFHIAQKYVILMENWRDHDFVKDILDLQAKDELGWPQLFLQSRPYTGTNHPYLIVASRSPLPQYQSLHTDEELRVA